ncbi:hypothetical protein MIR68_004618 [Amoeboaphelidium protococcarum]|nr:hypothetical protein MIR68_004618 [Amoeboaphelidium protococcarum]
MTPDFKSKIVVRRLPSNLPESVFKTTILQWMSKVNYFRYCPGSLGSEGAIQHSRAYLNFVDSQSVIEFSRVFNGWQFRNKQGQVHVALVEYAPCQDVPLGEQVVDDANKIIAYGEFEKHASESMPDYMKFILNLKELSQGISPLYAGLSTDTEIADKKTEPVNEEKLPVKTPLLQFITQRISSKQSKKSRKKDKKKKSGATKDSNKQKGVKQGSQNSKQTKDTQKQSQSENNQQSPSVTSGSQPARGSVLQIPSEKRQNRGRGRGRGRANVGGNVDSVQSIPNSQENTPKQQQQQQQKQQKQQDSTKNKIWETSDTQYNHQPKSQRGRGRGRGRGGGPTSGGQSQQT